MRVTVVQWTRSSLHVQINRVRLPATLFPVSLYPFFFLFGLSFFNIIFPFGLFFFVLTADHAGHTLESIYILSLSQEFYFNWKGISKVLDLHTGRAYDQIKTRSCQDMSLLWNSWIFFKASWHHDKQHTVHHKLYLFTPNTHQWPTGES